MWALGMRDSWLLQRRGHIFGSARGHETMSLSSCQADEQGTNLRKTCFVCILLNGGFQSLWIVWKVECSPKYPTERALSMLWVLFVDASVWSPCTQGNKIFFPCESVSERVFRLKMNHVSQRNAWHVWGSGKASLPQELKFDILKIWILKYYTIHSFYLMQWNKSLP